MATTPGYVSNAELAARISTLVDRWNTRENQMIALLTNPSGDVIVTDGTGANHTLPSFSQLQADVSALVDELSGAVATTQLAVTEANQHRLAAEAAATLAEASASSVGTAASDSAASAATAATHASTATTQANNAADSATLAGFHAANLGDAVGDAAASASNAAASASDASNAKATAEAAAVLSGNYANAPQGTQVAPGEYSAKHWASQAQAAVTGTLLYMGPWDASTGSYPAAPQKGHFYKVTVAGTVSGTSFLPGDQIVHNGATWDKIDNTDAVSTVAGKSGAVTLVMADITDKGALATLNAVNWDTHVTGKPSSFTPDAHTHAISEVTGLSTALAGKVETSTVDEAATGGTILKRTAQGDLQARLLRTTWANEATISGAIAYRINNTTDNYTRYCSDPAAILAFLGVPAWGSTATGNTLALRNASGYIHASYFNTSAPATTTGALSAVYVETGSDGFIRKAAPAAFKNSIGIYVQAGDPGAVADGSLWFW